MPRIAEIFKSKARKQEEQMAEEKKNALLCGAEIEASLRKYGCQLSMNPPQFILVPAKKV